MAIESERVLLGEIDDKEYYLNAKTGALEWRIPTIRESIEAEPGFVILAADFSQIEIKIMAFRSQDPWLIGAINSGKDIHSFFATEIYGRQHNFDYDLISFARKEENQHPRFYELSILRNGVKTTVNC